MIQATLSGLVNGSLFALIAIGFNLTFMVNRTVNFAHGQWVALGSLLAFTCLVQWQVPWLITCIGSATALGMMAIVLERIGVRPLLGHSLSLGFIMSTLAIGIMLENLALLYWGTTALYVPSTLGEARLSVLGAGIYPQELLILGTTVGILSTLAILYRGTSLRLSLHATAENAAVASLMGVNTKWTIACAYGIAGLMAGTAGVLVAPITGAMAAAGSHLSLKAFAIAIVGGLDSITGTLVAGLERRVSLYPGDRRVNAATVRSVGDTR
ncbi:branched-chain amino acid ABC transporter permease [Candidatus Entotheonella serta]|nr:branched-chain amino acid ABC transporter permease [Candidatus Entotheonella serta]